MVRVEVRLIPELRGWLLNAGRRHCGPGMSDEETVCREIEHRLTAAWVRDARPIGEEPDA